MKKNLGLTFIELIIIIAILTIVAIIIVPQIKNSIDNKKKTHQITRINGEKLEDFTIIDLNQDIEETPTTPLNSETIIAVEESKIINGIIIAKTPVNYNNDSNIKIEEYWFYIKRFDDNLLIWIKIDLETFNNKEIGQTYEPNK